MVALPVHAPTLRLEGMEAAAQRALKDFITAHVHPRAVDVTLERFIDGMRRLYPESTADSFSARTHEANGALLSVIF